ncbi:MAG: IclR family transcriptional regulator, partial [Desulfobacterales bacterium]|nr:IclR family transcriptional regulator [Desulfobacterales bacterium]
MKQDRSRLNSVEKALKILLAFQADRPSWGVRGLSAHLDFSPATVQRILQTLKSNGFVLQDAKTQQYRLGNIFYQFMDALQRSRPVVRTAQPFMERLLTRTMETVHLNAIDKTERLCIDTLESPQHLKASMPIGNRSPLHAGASSKCLLAFNPMDFVELYVKTISLEPITGDTIIDKEKLRGELARISRQGYAASLGERTPGLGSISAPILNHRGMAVAAMSLAIPEIRYRDDDHRRRCLEE